MIEIAHILLASAANPAPMSDGDFLWKLLTILSTVVSLVMGLLLIFGRNKPQERLVSFSEQFASKEALDKHVTTNQAEHDKLHARISSGDQRLAEELKGVGRELSGVKASNDIQTQHLLRVESKIDRVIEDKAKR